MIPYKIFPMYILGPLHISMYGVMFAIAFSIATFLAVQEARKRGIGKEIVYDLVVYLLVGGIIGARIFYVLFYWPENIPLHFFDTFKIWQGGLAYFGGFLGALVAGYVYIQKHKLNFWLYADICTIPLVIGHMFGRLGGYFTGLHPGRVTDMPWSIYLQGEFRHPVVLYEIIGLIIIAVLLIHLKKLKYFHGFLFSSYVVLYAIQRIILDFFRIESTDPRHWSLTPTQHLVILLFVLAVWFIGWNVRKTKIQVYFFNV